MNQVFFFVCLHSAFEEQFFLVKNTVLCSPQIFWGLHKRVKDRHVDILLFSHLVVISYGKSWPGVAFAPRNSVFITHTHKQEPNANAQGKDPESRP